MADERPWRVVILNASDAHLPAFVVMDRATRDVLQAPGGQQCGSTWYVPQGPQYVVVAPPY